MKIVKLFIVMCIITAIMTGARLQAATPEETFRKSYPNVPVDSFTPTAVPGLYEVISGFRIAYYAPEPDYLIWGEIVTRDGKNLTEERITDILGRKFKELHLEKALKIGTGPRTVIEITDPECDYCRRASAYLSQRKDLTRYVFLYPLSFHKKAEPMIRYIFCAADRTRAYEEAMTGKLDEMKFTTCQTAEVDELMKAHKEIGNRVWITEIGTPLFLIDGQVVRGANIPQMEKILGGKK
jgi:thiol:disulfide interchange protein DsbC